MRVAGLAVRHTAISILVSTFPNCVTLDKAFNLSMPQFLYLYNGDNDTDTHRVVKLLWGH